MSELSLSDVLDSIGARYARHEHEPVFIRRFDEESGLGRLSFTHASNSATFVMSRADVQRLLEYTGHTPRVVHLAERPE